MNEIKPYNDKAFSIQWGCQWPDLFRLGRDNWTNFTVINFQFEVGIYKGKYIEIYGGLLGFWFECEWADRTSRSVFNALMDQRISAAKEFLQSQADDEDDDGEAWKKGVQND